MNLPDVTEDALVRKADPALPGGSEMGRAIEAFLDFVEAQHQKHMQAQDLDPFAYDPEHTEHLEQFDGGYAPASGRVVLCTEVKGLRYEERSFHLEQVAVGDAVELRRDPENIFNANNFELYTMGGMTLGTLPAMLCNVLAPLYDTGIVQVEAVTASYIEQLEERSRYAKQGVLFVRLVLHLTS